MLIEQIIGISALIIGSFGLFYIFSVYSKFLKELKKGFAGISFGTLFGYFAILFLTLHVFDIIPETSAYIIILSFLSLAAILIAWGSNKILKIIKEVDKEEEKK